MNDRLPHEKGFHVSWDQIHRDARALAWRLDGRGPDNGAWRAVVGITRGGLVPAGRSRPPPPRFSASAVPAPWRLAQRRT